MKEFKTTHVNVSRCQNVQSGDTKRPPSEAANCIRDAEARCCHSAANFSRSRDEQKPRREQDYPRLAKVSVFPALTAPSSASSRPSRAQAATFPG
eukprot:2928810-Pleurochrysis_carterae.AAC.2